MYPKSVLQSTNVSARITVYFNYAGGIVMKGKRLVFALVLLCLALVLVLPGKAEATTEYKEGYYTYTVSNGEATVEYADRSIYGYVTIPSALGRYPVTRIDSSAFYECDNVISVTIPEGVTSIGENAFYNCDSLTSVTIPDGIVSFGDSVFVNCTSLQYNLYDTGKYLGNSKNPYVILMDTLAETVTSCTIPESTKFIYNNAFCLRIVRNGALSWLC